jgi:peroxiredoxin
MAASPSRASPPLGPNGGRAAAADQAPIAGVDAGFGRCHKIAGIEWAGGFDLADFLRRFAAGLALVLLALGSPASAHEPKVGQPAPDFTLTLVNGQTVNLSDLRGEVVVINFWATWCVPCLHELPTLDAYYQIQKHFGLRVFAATTEDSVPERRLHALFDKLTIEPVHRLHGPYRPLNGVPTNFVIDRNGVVRYAKAGAFDLDTLNAVLVPLLQQPRPAVTAAPTQVSLAAPRTTGY